MLLVESHTVNETKELNKLTFKCKNLYNKANYIIRQEFIDNGHYIQKFDMFTICKDLPEYKALPVRIGRGVLRTLDANWLSFFSCIKKWKSNKELFRSKPNLPKYLPKNGKFTALFYETAILKPTKKNPNTLGLSTLKMRIPVQTKNKIVEIQVIPTKTNKYKINVIYNYDEEKLKKDNKQYCSVDLGLNNLMTITSNKAGLQPVVVNGRPLKSINQYYNKKKAEYQSQLPKEVKTSKKIQKLTFKRNNKINDYLHKSTEYLVKFCLQNELNTLIVGYNELWKQEINIGKRNNQNFVNIPYYKLIQMLTYKCQKHGINFITHEESYTSKCSFLDNEEIKKHENYLGKRIKRGLFKSYNGTLINADVNGSYNIMKKVVPNAFADGIEDVAVHPYRVNL
jgi:putative transposase